MNLFEIEKEYIIKNQNGMSFSEIRKDLENKGLSNEQISVIIRSIDNKIIKGEHKKANNSKGKEIMFIGIAALTIGLIITLGTYLELFNFTNNYILAFGPIIGGLGLIGVGINKR